MSHRSGCRGLMIVLMTAAGFVVVVTALVALVEGQTGTLAGLMLLAVFGVACFRHGRRRQARASQAQVPPPQTQPPQSQARASQARAPQPQARAPRSPDGRRSRLGARIVRDALRMVISRH